MRQGWGMSVLEAAVATVVAYAIVPFMLTPWIEKLDFVQRIPALLLLPLLVVVFGLLLAVRRLFESLRS